MEHGGWRGLEALVSSLACIVPRAQNRKAQNAPPYAAIDTNPTILLPGKHNKEKHLAVLV
jgi:hypothetical protein